MDPICVLASFKRKRINSSIEVTEKLSAEGKYYIIRRKQIEPDCVERKKKITEKEHPCTHPDFPEPRNVEMRKRGVAEFKNI